MARVSGPQHPLNASAVYLKDPAKGVYRFSLGVKSPNVFLLLWRKLAALYRVFCNLAVPFFVPPSAPLAPHVYNVVQFGAKEQMARVDAFWDVAPMQHAHSVWYGSDTEFVRDSVCQQFSGFTALSNESVS